MPIVSVKSINGCDPDETQRILFDLIDVVIGQAILDVKEVKRQLILPGEDGAGIQALRTAKPAKAK
jgi:hypothetical protein